MRQVVLFVMLLSFGLGLPLAAQAKKTSAKSQGNPKYASLVMDAETGAILSQQNPDKVLHPASLTKIMTLMLLFEAMESGTVRVNDKIIVSQHAASQSPSKLGLKAGSSIRVEDAIYSVVTKSANDMAVAIGEHLAGSESRFADRMTRRARDIGMSKTVFKNASGLPNPNQVSSARDMATLARFILIRYPNYYHYFGTKQFTYRGVTMTNHNRLMQSYPGMDGFKTGFVNASGFNLVASAKRGDRRLIGVVFGGKSWKSRNDHMASLLNDGFKKGSSTLVASAKAPNAKVPVAAKAKTGTGAQSAAVKNPTTIQPQLMAKATVPSAAISPPIPGTLALPDVTEQAIKSVKTALNNGDYSELTGQGDYDPATTKRVETGLLAAAVYKGEYEAKGKPAAGLVLPPDYQTVTEQAAPQAQQVAYPAPVPATNPHDQWSVQIGAYTSRAATDDALRAAIARLPRDLSSASPLIVPLQTSSGVLFRARIGNLNQAQANKACQFFKDCLPVAPR